MPLLTMQHDNIIAHAAGRRIVGPVVTYQDRRQALLAYGYRPAVAAVVAAGGLDGTTARRLAVEVRLITEVAR